MLSAKVPCQIVLLLCVAWPLQGKTVYRIGVSSADYYPYSEVRDGDYIGLHRDLLDAFAEEANVQFEYVPLPYVRSVKEFLAGRLDFQYPDDPVWLPQGISPEGIYYSEPAIPYIDGVSQRNERSAMTLEQLRTVGTLIGFTLTGYCYQIKAGQLQLSEQPHVQGLIKQVLRQRLDGVYLNIAVVEHQQRVMGVSGRLQFNPQLPFRAGHYYLSSRGHEALIEQFNRFLVQEQVQIQALQARYGLSDTMRYHLPEPELIDEAPAAGQWSAEG